MSRFTGVIKQALKKVKGNLTGFCSDYDYNYQTLSTKLNPNDTKSWINVLELEDIIEHTQDTSILDHFCTLYDASWTFNSASNDDFAATSKHVTKEFCEALAELAQIDFETMNVRDANKLLVEFVEARDAANKKISALESFLQSQVKPMREAS